VWRASRCWHGRHRVGASYQDGLSRTGRGRSRILTSHNTTDVHREVQLQILAESNSGILLIVHASLVYNPKEGWVGCQWPATLPD
jgi:hypothetical protein